MYLCSDEEILRNFGITKVSEAYKVCGASSLPGLTLLPGALSKQPEPLCGVCGFL